MKPPKISVVIPSYNKVKFIRHTLESIFSQRYSNLEVIVQDGGSTDGTVELIKEFASKNKFKWESKPDGGQLDAINAGLKKATGDILTFINADDYYEPNTFKLVSDVYIKNPDALWFAGRGRVVNEKNKGIAKPFMVYKNRLQSLNSRFFLLVTNYLIQPSVFFTKKAFIDFGPFTGTKKFVMEYEFWLKLSNAEMPVILDVLLSNFRIESTTKTKTMFSEILDEDEKILHKYTKDGFIIMLHEMHNIGRKIVGRFV